MDNAHTPSQAAKLFTIKPFEAFVSGAHTSADGAKFIFTASDVYDIAKNYDPLIFKAPVVVGHPQMDTPAFGWVEKIAAEPWGKETMLKVSKANVTPEFADCAIKQQRYNKVSIALWDKADPSNPTPGKYYLRHVGFLGGAAPAITRLKPVEFSASPAIEFAADFTPSRDLRLMLSQMFDWLLEAAGLDNDDQQTASPVDSQAALPTAHTVADVYQGGKTDVEIADWVAQNDAAHAAKRQAAGVKPHPTINQLQDNDLTMAYTLPNGVVLRRAFAAPHSESNTKEMLMTPEQLAQREAELVAREKALADSERAALLSNRKAEFAAFAKGVSDEGKLLPAMEESAVAVMLALADVQAKPAFAAGSASEGKSALDVFKDMLGALPKQVQFGALAKPEAGAVAAHFAAPAGMQVDAEGAEQYAKALAYQAAHPGISIVDAALAVQAGNA